MNTGGSGGWYVAQKAACEYWKGRPQSEEHKRKIAESMRGKNKGRPQSEEHKRKISEAKKGKPAWNKGKGKPLSEETKRKMSEAKKGKKRVWNDETHTKFHYE